MIKTQHCPNCEATERKLSDFQQKVSDIVRAYTQNLVNYDEDALENLKTLIIPAPKRDPLEEVLQEIDHAAMWVDECAKEIRAALDARGLEIREKGQ
jgi:hypothetical protein